MATQEHIDLGVCTLHEVIGRGGTSVIWRGERLGTPVAIKFCEDAAREHEALCALRHPNIITLLDHGTLHKTQALPEEPSMSPGAMFLILEHAPRGSLQDIRHSLSWPQIRDILLTLLEALAHTHARGIIHRDIKPANVLTRAGTLTPADLLLSDFGLSWNLRPEHRVEPPPPVGTPSYMAPEQIRHQWRDQGPWTDLYAVGCLAWQLLHGHPPFTGDNEEEVLRAHLVREPPEYAPRVHAPERLRPWLQTMLSRRIHDRFHFAADAARYLHRLDSVSGLSPTLEPWGAPPSTGLTPDALLQGRRLPAVGRAGEFEALRSALHQSQQDARPRVVMLEGAPGEGASHIARAFLERSHALAKATTLHAPVGATEGLGALQAMVSRYFCVDGMSHEDTCARIREALRRMATPEDTRSTIRTDSHALADLVHQTNGPPLSWEDPDERVEALARWLGRRSRARPLLVWLDDAHQSPSTLALVRHVLTRLPSASAIVFILTLTSAPQPKLAATIASLHEIERVERRRLGPMTPLDYAAFLAKVLPLEPSVRAQVEARSERNPGVTRALLIEGLRTGALERNDGAWRMAPERSLPTPNTTRQQWEARIERALTQLPERAHITARTALELGALLSPELEPKVWRDACAQRGLELPRALLSFLHVTGLLRVRDGRWELAHPMLRETLTHHLQDATALHLACARALEGAPTERVLDHLIGAGSLEEARTLGFQEIRTEITRANFTRVECLLRHLKGACLEPEDRLAWWTSGVAMHTAQGMPGRAEALLERARDISATPAARAQLDVWAARIAALHGRAMDAWEYARRALTLSQDEQTRARALRAQGEAEIKLGRYGDASEHLLTALEVFEAQGDAGEHGRTLLALSRVYHALGDEEAGDALMEHASQGFEASGDVIAQASCHNLRGERARTRGALDEAVAHYREAYLLLRTLDSLESLVPCLNMVVTLIWLRDFDQARVLMEPLLGALEREGQLGHLGGLELAGLCCDAQDESWGSWDERFGRAQRHLTESGVFEADTASLATLAADAARDAGHRDRATRAYRLAYQQWVGVPDFGRADDVMRELERLAQPGT